MPSQASARPHMRQSRSKKREANLAPYLFAPVSPILRASAFTQQFALSTRRHSVVLTHQVGSRHSRQSQNLISATQSSPFVTDLPDRNPTPASSNGAPSRVVPDKIVTVAAAAAEAAGAVIRKYFRARPEDLGIEFKGDDSPVTRADRETELAIRVVIKEAFPAHRIIGEEAGDTNADRNDAGSPYSWVVDPIDGTKAFITGRPTFGTLIAVLYEGTPIFGVVDQPITRERWMGGNGRPTTLNGDPVRVKVYGNDVGLSKCILQATTPDMFVGLDGVAFRMLARQVKQTIYGSDCYAYALLASGCADLVVEADLKIWDFMALVPVVEAAGGRMTDWYGRPLSLQSDGRVIAAASVKHYGEAIDVLTACDDSFKRELMFGEGPVAEDVAEAVLPTDPGPGNVESMTGFGIGIANSEKFSVTAQLRSVNSRYCEVQVRGPRVLIQYDSELSAIVKKEAVRGKLMLNLDMKVVKNGSLDSIGRNLQVVVDKDSARAVRNLLDEVSEAAALTAEPTVADILGFSEVLVKRDVGDLGEEMLPVARIAVIQAVKNLRSARRQEGALLQIDLMKRTNRMSRLLDEIEERAPARVERELVRLRNLIKEANVEGIESSRVATEVTLFADRVDISEEIVRLRAHISVFNFAFLGADEPIGQRLSFLLQEMNREATTIASKSYDAPISHLGVLVKEEIEKIREQCQNIR